MQRGRQRFPQTFGALLLAPVLFLSCGETQPGPEDIRTALGGKRYVGPALTGLPEADDCTVSDDFIPKIRCGSAPAQDRLRRLEQKLLAQLGQKARPAQLRDSAVVRLAADPDSKRVRQAVALLSEALKDETDPQVRADLLTDLSAAYLLQAETDQSAMELGFALDTALQALELDPSSEAAEFNKRFALILLGVERADPSVDGALLVDVDQTVFFSQDRTPVDGPGCPTVQEMREALDRWAQTDSASPFEVTDTQKACIAKAADRWVADLLLEANRDALRFRAQWQRYRSAVASLLRFEASDLREHLDALKKLAPGHALLIDAEYLEALIDYHAKKYRDVESRLVSQAEKAATRGYFEIAATSMRTIATVVGLAGRYGEAVSWNEKALEMATRSGSIQTIAAVRSQALEFQALAGKEDRAWLELATALRTLSSDTRTRQIDLALTAAARLAGERDLHHATLLFQGRSIEMRADLPAVALVEALLNRALLYLAQGRTSDAKSDYELAARKLENANRNMLGRQHAQATLALFQGLVEDDPRIRSSQLQIALDSFQAAGNVRRATRIQLELARVEIGQGELKQARQTLELGMEELQRQVRASRDWRLATALVADARPLVTEMLGLPGLSISEVKSVLSQYLGFRSIHASPKLSLPTNVVRLTYFARDLELLLLLESDQEAEVARIQVSREELGLLRGVLLSQLETGMPKQRVDATLEDLSGFLLSAIDPRWFQKDQWIIIAGDILAGIPFHLLPMPNSGFAGSEGTGSEGALLDHVSVSYAFDHRNLSSPNAVSRILAVGAGGRGSGLPLLPNASQEAHDIATLYENSVVTTSTTPESLLRQVRAEENRLDALHIASHFELNPRSPLDSALVLDTELNSSVSGRLPIGQLLDEVRDLDLLFFSACQTGSSLPIAAHGLHSMAQAFSAEGVLTTVLSLWQVDDKVGAEIAVRFHELILSGQEPSEALRTAQLEQRERHPPSVWGPFALFH